jgi:hypothetical protein
MEIMTKTTMPDPVAWAHRDILRRGNAVERIQPNARYGAESLGLYTAEQAEAYANARVREALELAAYTCAGIAIPTSHDEPNKQVALECALAIRAMIPSTPARPESEQ